MKSLFDLIKDKRRQEFSDESPIDSSEGEEPASFETPDASHGFSIGLKRKRRSVMLKNMLVDAGYGDLAKMINIKET